MYRSHVLVCGGTGCTSSGSQQIMETLKDEIDKARPFGRRSAVVQTGCHGLCALGSDHDRLPGCHLLLPWSKNEDIPEIVIRTSY